MEVMEFDFTEGGYDGAYAVAQAYYEHRTRREAIAFLKDKCPHIEESTAIAMWNAIDAYVDVYA
jgi:hypothetical protein